MKQQNTPTYQEKMKAYTDLKMSIEELERQGQQELANAIRAFFDTLPGPDQWQV